MLLINDLAVRVAGRLLIEHAAAQIPTGARVGLVGRNGAGKSTLFRVIAGELAPEHGDVTLPRRWRIGRLSQEAPDGPELTPVAAVTPPATRSATFAPMNRSVWLQSS